MGFFDDMDDFIRWKKEITKKDYDFMGLNNDDNDRDDDNDDYDDEYEDDDDD
jgi:hypothetical protein